MLLKNAQGHKPAPASAASTLAANNPANNPAAVGESQAPPSPTAAAGPAAAASGATSAPPVVVGSGSIELVVTHGKVRKLVALTPRARALNPSPSPIAIPVPTSVPKAIPSRRATWCGARRRLL
jgi:hypothetical protein